MSTLSSSSSLAEIQAAYDDNGSYDTDGSAARVLSFPRPRIPAGREW